MGTTHMTIHPPCTCQPQTLSSIYDYPSTKADTPDMPLADQATLALATSMCHPLLTRLPLI